MCPFIVQGSKLFDYDLSFLLKSNQKTNIIVNGIHIVRILKGE